MSLLILLTILIVIALFVGACFTGGVFVAGTLDKLCFRINKAWLSRELVAFTILAFTLLFLAVGSGLILRGISVLVGWA